MSVTTVILPTVAWGGDCTVADGTLTFTTEGSEHVIVERVDDRIQGTFDDGSDAIVGCVSDPGAVETIDLIRVTAAADGGSTFLVLDLAGGRLEPGATAEGSGASEIEVEVDLRNGGGDVLAVKGSRGSDHIAVGSTGFDLNGDDDGDDVAITGVERFFVDLRRGDDVFRGTTGSSTGAAFASTLAVSGGPGADDIEGGAARDLIEGGGGLDEISGRAGPDVIHGGNGDDYLRGDRGRDVVEGASGNDDVVIRDGIVDAARGGKGQDCVIRDPGDEVRGFEIRRISEEPGCPA